MWSPHQDCQRVMSGMLTFAAKGSIGRREPTSHEAGGIAPMRNDGQEDPAIAVAVSISCWTIGGKRRPALTIATTRRRRAGRVMATFRNW